MSVDSSRVTDKLVTTTGEIRPVAIQTNKGDSSKAMTKEVSKATIPTGSNKDHHKTGGIVINRHKIGVTITSRRKEDKAMPPDPSKIIKITLTSNEATGPKTGHHKGLRKTGVVNNNDPKEEMIQSNRYTIQRRSKLSAFLNITSPGLIQRSKKTILKRDYITRPL